MKKEEFDSLARTIVDIERELDLGKSVQECEALIEYLIHDLTIDELLLLDEYIQKYLT